MLCPPGLCYNFFHITQGDCEDRLGWHNEVEIDMMKRMPGMVLIGFSIVIVLKYVGINHLQSAGAQCHEMPKGFNHLECTFETRCR